MLDAIEKTDGFAADAEQSLDETPWSMRYTVSAPERPSQVR